MKSCNKCSILKELSAFNKDPRNKDGLQGICIECRKAAKQYARERNALIGPKVTITKKLCNKCQTVKETACFFKDIGIADGFATICKDCKTKSSMSWRDKNRDRYNANQREHHKKHYLRNRLYRYELTPEQHNKMLEEQKQVCAICEKANPSSKRSLAVDHHHDTGKVRGILCYGCNRAVSAFDDPVLFEKIMTYIKKYKD